MFSPVALCVEGTGEKDVAQLGAELEDRAHCDQLRQAAVEQQCREDPQVAEEMHVAARKIQALYRGHIVRRQSQSLRERALMVRLYVHNVHIDSRIDLAVQDN